MLSVSESYFTHKCVNILYVVKPFKRWFNGKMLIHIRIALFREKFKNINVYIFMVNKVYHNVILYIDTYRNKVRRINGIFSITI